MSEPQGPTGATDPSTGGSPGAMGGMFRDPSTLAATGLLASALNVLGGIINSLSDPGVGGFRERLYQLTDVVEIGDVALLGLAVALLVLTEDPPGGVSRPLLLNVDAVLAALVGVLGVVRALVWVTDGNGPGPNRLAGFLVTLGLALAAATVAYWAARESFLKEQLHGRH
jgi:hypothetical protein